MNAVKTMLPMIAAVIAGIFIAKKLKLL